MLEKDNMTLDDFAKLVKGEKIKKKKPKKIKKLKFYFNKDLTNEKH